MYDSREDKEQAKDQVDPKVLTAALFNEDSYEGKEQAKNDHTKFSAGHFEEEISLWTLLELHPSG